MEFLDKTMLKLRALQFEVLEHNNWCIVFKDEDDEYWFIENKLRVIKKLISGAYELTCNWLIYCKADNNEKMIYEIYSYKLGAINLMDTTMYNKHVKSKVKAVYTLLFLNCYLYANDAYKICGLTVFNNDGRQKNIKIDYEVEYTNSVVKKDNKYYIDVRSRYTKGLLYTIEIDEELNVNKKEAVLNHLK